MRALINFTKTSIMLLIAAMAADAFGAEHFYRYSDDGRLAHIFNLLSCAPNCDREDQAALTADSLIEKELVNAINSAQKSVVFSQYTFSRKPILDALIAASIRGVQVRGVVDKGQIRSLNEFCSGQVCTGFPSPFDSEQYKVASTQMRLSIASTTSLFNSASNSEKLAILLEDSSDGSGMKFLGGGRLLHHKFVLIDNDTLLSGSGNWSSTAVSINFENLTISRDEKDTKPFACVFNAMWGDALQRSQATAACQTDDVFFVPVGAAADRILEDITSSIQNSQRTIDIAMHHLVHPVVFFELTRALQRGVNVRLVTDDDICIQKMSPELRDLVNAGIKIRYIPTTCSMFQLAHNKFAVFDREKVINGSGNWSRAGLERNFENFKSSTESFSVDVFHSAFEKFWLTGVERDACTCDRSLASCKERYCLGARP